MGTPSLWSLWGPLQRSGCCRKVPLNWETPDLSLRGRISGKRGTYFIQPFVFLSCRRLRDGLFRCHRASHAGNLCTQDFAAEFRLQWRQLEARGHSLEHHSPLIWGSTEMVTETCTGSNHISVVETPAKMANSLGRSLAGSDSVESPGKRGGKQQGAAATCHLSIATRQPSKAGSLCWLKKETKGTPVGISEGYGSLWFAFKSQPGLPGHRFPGSGVTLVPLNWCMAKGEFKTSKFVPDLQVQGRSLALVLPVQGHFNHPEG